MKKQLLLSLILAAPVVSQAQRLQTNYIEWPESSSFPSYVQKWQPGTPLFEDENFFISRVRTKPLIARNSALQIYPEINDATDKNLLFWVPVGNTNLNGVHTDALPNGLFDSEVFSMWSYVTHYGDWTSPHGWVPGGFADAAHKHGVAVTGVASIPNATLQSDNNWYKCLNSSGALDVTKAGDFLRYHGVNGLGYNSEYGISSSIQAKLRDFHVALNQYMADKDPLFEIVAYDGVSDGGSIAFSEHLCATNQNNFGSSDKKATNLFLNYNWNNSAFISESQSYCDRLGRSMKELYAGMNMQGGCKTSTEWQTHLTCPYSIGLWGAHDFNYLWAPRAQFGSSDASKQATYQKLLEWWFTNGQRNPAAKMEVYPTKNLSSNAKFFGMSRFMSARSSLGWNLAEEPFVTYFNLGNGQYFNFNGERTCDRPWYNIGIQDYMPTWRFWFADSFLGNEPANVPEQGLDASFTWEDAYFGGSCLKIEGSTTDEFLHLFRTNFKIERNDVITVRYKLMSGSANVSLALSGLGNETSILRESSFKVLGNDQMAKDVWVEKQFSISGPLVSSFTTNPLAMIALHFTDAENLELFLGEISIRRGTYATPNAPKITLAKVFAFNQAGVDAKVIFEMPNNKAAGEPCYNIDVNTSVFKLWSQQEGEEPILNNATSSWAAMFYAAPMNLDGKSRIRFGIQASGLDNKSESEITWTDYLDAGDYALSNEIAINKTTIKPGESFEIGFTDPRHQAAQWTITDQAGKEVDSATGTSIVCNGLDQLGSYNVIINKGDADETAYDNFFMITAWDKGALPQIENLTFDGNTLSTDEAVNISSVSEFMLGYTGRNANGESSQAIRINEHFVGANTGEVGIEPHTSFALGAWINFMTPVGESRLIAIENRSATWPTNHWGWLWSSLNPDGSWQLTFRLEGRPDSPNAIVYKFDRKWPFNAWVHLAFSIEYKDSDIRCRTFFNGEELIPSSVAMKTTDLTSDNPDDWWYSSNGYDIAKSDWFAFGGGAGSSPVFNDGAIDELTVWNTAITADDARKAMNGFDADNLPKNVQCYWSFEERATDDNTFLSKGAKPGVAASDFEAVALEGEGQGMQVPTVPFYTAGAPTLAQTGFKVETTPQWRGFGVNFAEQTGNDTEGSTKASTRAEGDYEVTLTLENVLGSDVRKYPVLSASDGSGIADVESGEIDLYTTNGSVIINFVEEGSYSVAAYDIEGRQIASRSQNFGADGGQMVVTLNREGVILLQIAKDGCVTRTAKVALKR